MIIPDNVNLNSNVIVKNGKIIEGIINKKEKKRICY